MENLNYPESDGTILLMEKNEFETYDDFTHFIKPLDNFIIQLPIEKIKQALLEQANKEMGKDGDNQFIGLNKAVRYLTGGFSHLAKRLRQDMISDEDRTDIGETALSLAAILYRRRPVFEAALSSEENKCVNQAEELLMQIYYFARREPMPEKQT